jgi:hypothetical protein
MTTHKKAVWTRGRQATILLAAGMMLFAFTSFPRPVSAAETAGPCMDAAWASYAECLVQSDLELWKKLCDLDFFVAVAICFNTLRWE